MWHYQIMYKQEKGKSGKLTYGLHEVYRNKKGKIWGWTKEPLDLDGYESQSEITATLLTMLLDSNRHEPLNYNMKPQCKLVVERRTK